MVLLYFVLAMLQEAAAPALTVSSTPARTFAVVDLRSPKERKGKALSAFMFSCNVGVFAIPDDGLGMRRVGRGRVARLERALLDRFGAKMSGHQLELKKYSFVINGSPGAQRVGIDLVTGDVGANRIFTNGASIKPKCSREKMAAGWFDPSELTNNHTPLIVEIEGLFDGKPLYVRAVRSPYRSMTIGINILSYDSEDEAEFNAVLDDANRKLADIVAERVVQTSSK